jgi:hypothetical protein
MAGFKFSTGSIEIEIEEKKYPVNSGNPAIQDGILNFSIQLMSTNLADIDGRYVAWVSQSIHDYIIQLLGAEAEAEIFEGRELNVMDELRLFTYIQEQISNDKNLTELEAALGRYSAGNTL